MTNAIIRSASAALFAVALLPAVAFAQTRANPGFDPRATAGGQSECTQLERSVGVKPSDCGTLTLSELSLLKADKENTN